MVGSPLWDGEQGYHCYYYYYYHYYYYYYDYSSLLLLLLLVVVVVVVVSSERGLPGRPEAGARLAAAAREGVPAPGARDAQAGHRAQSRKGV